jgi:hypothetical protein
MSRVTPLLASLLLSGCGSAATDALPPPAAAPAGPQRAVADGGRTLAVVHGRQRVLALHDARTHRRLAAAPAGVGPTGVACGDWCWVTDTRGDALLVYRLRPRLEIVRRLYLPGRPYRPVLDRGRRRLRVTLAASGERLELPAHGRPHVLRRLRPPATARSP